MRIPPTVYNLAVAVSVASFWLVTNADDSPPLYRGLVTFADAEAVDRWHREEWTTSSAASMDTDHHVPHSTTRPGYQIPPTLLRSFPAVLSVMDDDTSLRDDGVQLLNLQEWLADEGIARDTLDVSRRQDRLRIGAAMIRAMEAFVETEYDNGHNGDDDDDDDNDHPKPYQIFHAADQSRCDGSVYGEATVRNTTDTQQRHSHHGFHIDKYLKGISQRYSGQKDGATVTMEEYRDLWEPDVTKHFVGKTMDDVLLSLQPLQKPTRASNRNVNINSNATITARAYNLWLCLTPDGIQQSPLAVLKKDSSGSGSGSGSDGHRNDYDYMTQIVYKTGEQLQLRDTITLISQRAFQDNINASILFRPHMKFGEALLFPTTETAHSAIYLLNDRGEIDPPPEDPRYGRVSAEMRFLLL